MSKEKETVSEGLETRTYTEISQDLKTGSTAEDKTPDAGAGQAEDTKVEDTDDVTEPDQPSKPDEDTEPQTLEEANALLRKERLERQNAQSKIGTQGNELGDLRKRLAKLEADDAVAKPAETKHKSYTELFKEDKRFAGMNDQTKEYMGAMFDTFESEVLKKVPSTPEVENLRRATADYETQQIQTRWKGETDELIEAHGKLLIEKYGPDITAEVTKMIEDGVHPSKISVEKVFKQLAFDDPELRAKPHYKDGLNERAGKRHSKTSTKTPEVTVDVSKMSGNAAFRAILEERKKKGLEL